MENEMKKHWETVYETKNPDQVSWTQETPKTSLEFIHSFGLKKTAKIIDIGGGDSKLVDYLLDEGFENINFNAPEWISNDLNWSITDEVSYNGSYCLKLQNQGLAEGTKQTLESKTLNLSDSSKAYFTFKYAYARKNSSNNDFLRILGSYDCGKTWATRKIIYTNQLITAADQNNFIPTYSEWKEANIVSLIGPFCVATVGPESPKFLPLVLPFLTMPSAPDL